MNDPLPPDIVSRVHQDFGSRADAVLDFLRDCRHSGNSDYLCDRFVRCIVFAARGEESRIPQLIGLMRQDFRDVIMAAEYDTNTLVPRRLRDFNFPFESAEIP